LVKVASPNQKGGDVYRRNDVRIARHKGNPSTEGVRLAVTLKKGEASIKSRPSNGELWEGRTGEFSELIQLVSKSGKGKQAAR